MTLKFLPLFLLITTFAIVPCFAQSSAVLTHSNNNEEHSPFSYEQKVDAPGTEKAVLYDRVKKWIIGNLKASQESLFFDDAEKGSITANTAIPLKDNLRLSSQRVEFKLSISFKNDKMRIQATDFVYRSIYPGTIYQKPFEDLHPFAKGLKRSIYEEFDGKFNALIKALTATALDTKEDNW